MKIAIPTAAGKLSAHFGHCESFAILDVDMNTKKVSNRVDIKAPPHQPGLLPPWLAQQGANMIIAGGMGAHAQELFAQHDIQVILGAPSESPETIVGCYLSGSLRSGQNVCDHEAGHECNH